MKKPSSICFSKKKKNLFLFPLPFKVVRTYIYIHAYVIYIVSLMWSNEQRTYPAIKERLFDCLKFLPRGSAACKFWLDPLRSVVFFLCPWSRFILFVPFLFFFFSSRSDPSTKLPVASLQKRCSKRSWAPRMKSTRMTSKKCWKSTTGTTHVQLNVPTYLHVVDTTCRQQSGAKKTLDDRYIYILH